jgi:hypothetical protein
LRAIQALAALHDQVVGAVHRRCVLNSDAGSRTGRRASARTRARRGCAS